MKIALFSFNTEYMMRIDQLAIEAENRNFESLWVPEHTHIPVPKSPDPSDPETGMPLSPANFFLPEEYRHMADPFLGLAAAAAVTERIKLGTCVCLVNQHHPINLAKSISTLEILSNGRFIFGVGAGWNIAEMNHHGVSFKSRWRELRERLKAIKTIWENDVARFQGEFIDFEELWQFPKPINKEGPPIVFGTLDTLFGREQVARYADGWLPLTFNVEETKTSIELVKRRMEELGREPSALDVSLFFLEDQTLSDEQFEIAQTSGANRMILRLPLAEEKEMLKVLDLYSKYVNSNHT